MSLVEIIAVGKNLQIGRGPKTFHVRKLKTSANQERNSIKKTNHNTKGKVCATIATSQGTLLRIVCNSPMDVLNNYVQGQ